MTNQEMTKFLKSKKLKLAHSGEPFDNVNYIMTGPGWFELIADTITKLIDLGWNKEVSDVKEKFGGLRFYVPYVLPEDQEKIINDAEVKSFTICENCSKPGKYRIKFWMRTQCDKCNKEYLAGFDK